MNNKLSTMDKPLFQNKEFVPVVTAWAVQELTFGPNALKLGLVIVTHLISNRTYFVAW